MAFSATTGVLGALLLTLSFGVADARDVVCLTLEEAREAVAHEGLARPAAVQREAASHAHADPLRSRLCRWNNELVYEITMLRRDGKITHVYVAAHDGLIVHIPDD